MRIQGVCKRLGGYAAKVAQWLFGQLLTALLSALVSLALTKLLVG